MHELDDTKVHYAAVPRTDASSLNVLCKTELELGT